MSSGSRSAATKVHSHSRPVAEYRPWVPSPGGANGSKQANRKSTESDAAVSTAVQGIVEGEGDFLEEVTLELRPK